MYWDLNEAQRLIQSSARDFCQRYSPISALRACEADGLDYAPSVLRELHEKDWHRLAYPVDAGGTGGDLIAQLLFHEELGRALAPVPVLSTHVIGGGLLYLSRNRPAANQALADVLDRAAVIGSAFVHLPAHFSVEQFGLELRRSGPAMRLSGQAAFVPHARSASYLLLPARMAGAPDELAVLLLDPAATPPARMQRLESLAGPPLYDLEFEDAVVPDAAVILTQKEIDGIRNVIARSTLLLCAQLVGASERAYEIARQYASERIQFGRPIGSYQRVQDMVIAARNACDAARLAVWRAAAAKETEFAFEVSVAKAIVGRAAVEATFQAHEVLGGVGFMLEFDLQLYTRTARVGALLHGAPAEHLRYVGHSLLRGPSRLTQHALATTMV